MKLFIRFNDIILRTQPTLRFGKLFWAKMGSWPERMLVQYNNTLDKSFLQKILEKWTDFIHASESDDLEHFICLTVDWIISAFMCDSDNEFGED